jgi:hypothetical protein
VERRLAPASSLAAICCGVLQPQPFVAHFQPCHLVNFNSSSASFWLFSFCCLLHDSSWLWAHLVSCCQITMAKASLRKVSSTSHEAPSPPSSVDLVMHNERDANIRNFAPVARIMKSALPENAKIAKEAKECMQECVSEFISFITSEGMFDVLFCNHYVDHLQLPRSVSRRSARPSTAKTFSLQ